MVVVRIFDISLDNIIFSETLCAVENNKVTVTRNVYFTFGTTQIIEALKTRGVFIKHQQVPEELFLYLTNWKHYIVSEL